MTILKAMNAATHTEASMLHFVYTHLGQTLYSDATYNVSITNARHTRKPARGDQAGLQLLYQFQYNILQEELSRQAHPLNLVLFQIHI